MQVTRHDENRNGRLNPLKPNLGQKRRRAGSTHNGRYKGLTLEATAPQQSLGRCGLFSVEAAQDRRQRARGGQVAGVRQHRDREGDRHARAAAEDDHRAHEAGEGADGAEQQCDRDLEQRGGEAVSAGSE